MIAIVAAGILGVTAMTLSQSATFTTRSILSGMKKTATANEALNYAKKLSRQVTDGLNALHQTPLDVFQDGALRLQNQFGCATAPASPWHADGFSIVCELITPPPPEDNYGRKFYRLKVTKDTHSTTQTESAELLVRNRAWPLVPAPPAPIITFWRMAIDANNEVYVSGSITGEITKGASAGGQDGIIRKYRSDGSIAWQRQIGTAQTDSLGAGLRVFRDPADHQIYVYAAGLTQGNMQPGYRGGSDTDADIYIVKFDAAGNRIWTKQFGSTNKAVDDLKFIDVDTAGNIYLAGTTAGGIWKTGFTSPGYGTSANGYSSYFLKLDKAGNPIGVNQFDFAPNDGNGITHEWIWGLRLGSGPNPPVYISGQYGGRTGDLMVIKMNNALTHVDWWRRWDAEFKTWGSHIDFWDTTYDIEIVKDGTDPNKDLIVVPGQSEGHVCANGAGSIGFGPVASPAPEGPDFAPIATWSDPAAADPGYVGCTYANPGLMATWDAYSTAGHKTNASVVIYDANGYPKSADVRGSVSFDECFYGATSMPRPPTTIGGVTYDRTLWLGGFGNGSFDGQHHNADPGNNSINDSFLSRYYMNSSGQILFDQTLFLNAPTNANLADVQIPTTDLSVMYVLTSKALYKVDSTSGSVAWIVHF